MSRPEVLHVPTRDGSCRLVRPQDWESRDKFLLWLDAHCEFYVGSRPSDAFDVASAPLASAAPMCRPGFWAGPLEHPSVVEHVCALLATEVETLKLFFSPDADKALLTLRRLLAVHPALVHIAPVRQRLFEALWRQEKEFLVDLAAEWRALSSERNQEGRRIREDFQHLLDMREAARDGESVLEVAAEVQALRSEREPGNLNLPDATAIAKGAERARRAGIQQVLAMALLRCPEHRSGQLHSAQRPACRWAPVVHLSEKPDAPHRDFERVVVIADPPAASPVG